LAGVEMIHMVQAQLQDSDNVNLSIPKQFATLVATISQPRGYQHPAI